MQKYTGIPGDFKRKTLFLAIPFISFLLTSCGNGRAELLAYSKLLGVDLDSGEIISYEDNHGGFLGDGFMLCISKYEDEKVEEQIKVSEKFSKYPLSKNLSTFLYGEDWDAPFDSSLKIPKFDNGYFFFSNRHKDAKHELTDEDLFDTVSFNFTFILYDCDANLAYTCDYDT